MEILQLFPFDELVKTNLRIIHSYGKRTLRTYLVLPRTASSCSPSSSVVFKLFLLFTSPIWHFPPSIDRVSGQQLFSCFSRCLLRSFLCLEHFPRPVAFHRLGWSSPILLVAVSNWLSPTQAEHNHTWYNHTKVPPKSTFLHHNEQFLQWTIFALNLKFLHRHCLWQIIRCGQWAGLLQYQYSKENVQLQNSPCTSL